MLGCYYLHASSTQGKSSQLFDKRVQRVRVHRLELCIEFSDRKLDENKATVSSVQIKKNYNHKKNLGQPVNEKKNKSFPRLRIETKPIALLSELFHFDWLNPKEAYVLITFRKAFYLKLCLWIKAVDNDAHYSHSFIKFPSPQTL